MVMTSTENKKCFDRAIGLLARRPHGCRELSTKLRRKSDAAEVQTVIEKLIRLKFLDDAAFAKTLTASLQRKQFGKRRTMLELSKRGIAGELAQQVVREAYAETDQADLARQFAKKQLPRLRKLQAIVAKRRLIGSLARRGFDGETIRSVVNNLLKDSEPDSF